MADETQPQSAPDGDDVALPGAALGTEVTPPAEDPAPRDVELVCDVDGCGRGFATVYNLNRHRENQHGAPRVPTGRERAKAGTPREGLGGALRDAAGLVNPKRSGPPSVDELQHALGRLTQTASVAGASYLAETDPRIEHDDAAIDATVADLALTKEEAEQVLYPVARMIGRSKLNARVGRTIVENVEVGESVAVLLTVALRWRRYGRARTAAIKAQRVVPEPAAARLATAEGVLATNGSVPYVPGPVGESGVLATPETVARIAAQGNG